MRGVALLGTLIGSFNSVDGAVSGIGVWREFGCDSVIWGVVIVIVLSFGSFAGEKEDIALRRHFTLAIRILKRAVLLIMIIISYT